MRKLICIFLLLSLTTPAHAADCIEKACIDVYTQDGKIVIEGRKGSGPVQKKSVAPAPARTKKPVIKKSPTPKPRTSGSAKPRIIPTRKPPVIRKPVIRTSKPQSLSDKLTEMLPTAGISYSPSFEPLINVPVFFWSDIPEVITKRIEIVGEFVDVQLKPTFFWHYGDGVVYVTTKAGAPFPDGQIRHTYQKPGHYLIELITSWAGDFIVDGVRAHINGDVLTVAVLPITVVAAPTRFTPSITYTR